MKTIWKFFLSMQDEQSVVMPTGAQLLCVKVQGGQPCVWAVVDPAVGQRGRVIRIHGTSHALADDIGAYVDTFFLHDGALVFHVFDQGYES